MSDDRQLFAALEYCILISCAHAPTCIACFFYLYSIKPEERPREKVIPCRTKNRWILPRDAKLVNSLDRQAAEELMKG